MSGTAFADWEVSVVLPLGVVASQLARIESQLRLVNIRAVGVEPSQGGTPAAAAIDAKLDHINEALDTIRDLVAGIGADVRPKARPSRED